MNPVTATKIASDGVTKVNLEKMKYILITQLDASLLEGEFDVQFWEDFAGEIITARVVGFVWGEPFGGRTIRYPRNWIEAIKARWAPRWFRRLSPVRYKVHYIEAKAYYPDWYPHFPDKEWRLAAYIRNLEEVDHV